jgi:hypothetical protein
MIRAIAFAAASLALVAGCASAPKQDDALVIQVGDDGKMRVVSAGDSEEGQALAALMQAALDSDLADELRGEPEDQVAPEVLDEDEIWRADAAGNLTHIQSGAQCPMRWGEYVRGRTSIFQPDGMDVGCNYGNGAGTVMTFYVYQSPENLAVELDETFETMKTRQPVSAEAPFGGPPASKAYVARTLAYETADRTRMRTSVLLTDGGSWRLKIRLTCRADDATRTETAAGIALMGQADRLASTLPPKPVEKPSPV